MTVLTVAGLIVLGLLIHEKIQGRQPSAIIINSVAAIESPSQHTQETVAYTAARKESGRQMSEQLKAEIRKEYPNGFAGLTKSEIEKMNKDKVALIAILLLEENRTLNSRLGRKVETPVSFTQAGK